jgi:hypothetical protein
MVIRIPWWVVGVIGSTLSLMCPWVMVLVSQIWRNSFGGSVVLQVTYLR